MVDLAALARQVDRKYGDGVVIRLTQTTPSSVEGLPTGCFVMDRLTGIGGIPRGRLSEFFGPQMSGKTTVLLEAAREAIAKGLAVLYLDYECAFDAPYARALGLPVESPLFVLMQPISMDDGLEIAEKYIKARAVALIIFDSLAAMAARVELESELGKEIMAPQARVLGKALRRLTGEIHRSNVAVVFINQIRTVIDMSPMGKKGRIKKTRTPGGDALKFYASLRCEFQPIGSAKGRIRDLVTGNLEVGLVAFKIRVRTVKNKLAPPFRDGIFYIRFGTGISETMNMIDIGIARGFLHKTGAMYTVSSRYMDTGDPASVRGAEKLIRFLEEEAKWDVLYQDCVDVVEDKVVDFAGEVVDTEAGLGELLNAEQVDEAGEPSARTVELEDSE